MAQTKPKAGQFYGVSGNGTDGQFLQTDGAGGMDWATPVTNPTLTSIDYPGSTTAADPAGGESIIINGTGFQTGITCTIGGTSATTAFNSATQITITSPAKAAGQYTVAVTNTDGGNGDQANFIQYSGVPVWTTNSGSLGSVEEGGTTSFQVTATEGSDTIEYAVTSGSLPSGYSLATATGAITGTAGAVSADTTSTFSITATDDENQTSSARSFSITVTNLVPSGFINAKIYTGNGSTAGSYPSIGGSLDVATDFTPDLVIVKARDAATGWPIGDSIRGNYGYIYLNSTSASGSACGGYGSNPCGGANGDGGIGIGTNKFIVKDDGSGNYGVSGPGTLYVSYAWKAGGAPTATNSGGQTPTSGSKMIDGSPSTTNFATATNYPEKQTINTALDFSMTLWTAGGAMEFPHGLSGTPDFMFIKGVSATEDWYVYHNAVGTGKYLSTTRNDGGSGAGTDGEQTNANLFSTVNSTVVATNITGTSLSYMCYAWKNVAGFSKFGSYTGNGSATGPIVETGFKPAIIIIKRTDGNGEPWAIYDSTRNTSNPRNCQLRANTAGTENCGSDTINFYSNGFQPITNWTGYNGSGGTYIYAAWAADGSTTTPSLANSFQNFTWSGNGSAATKTGLNFQPDAIFWKAYNNSSYNWKVVNSVRGKSLNTTTYDNVYLNLTNTQASDNALSAINASSLDFASGGNGNVNGLNYIGYSWKGGGLGTINTAGTQTSVVSANQAAGFSVVYSTSASSGNYTWGHGLSKAPEFWTYKALDYAYGWETLYPKTFGVDAGSLSASDWEYIVLNTDAAKVTNTHYAADNSVLASVGGGWGQLSTFIAYCWHSVAGYSKIGTYTATGSAGSPTITTDFQPGVVFMKNVDRVQEWVVIDSARGLTQSINTNSASTQYTGNTISTNATSFTIDVSGGGINYASGDTFLYMAFKQN